MQTSLFSLPFKNYSSIYIYICVNKIIKIKNLTRKTICVFEIETFKDLPLMLNRKQFHSFDDIRGMLEKLASTNLPDNLFTDDQHIRKIRAEFNVKDSPNSRKIATTLENSRGLDEFSIYIVFYFVF